MTEVTYFFNAYDTVTEKWTTTPQYMVDNILTNYASTTVNNQVQRLTGNTCSGTNLGTISKVELRAYAYDDGDDKLFIRPEFTGGTGNNHITVPGISGAWGNYQEVGVDKNSPAIKVSHDTGGGAYIGFNDTSWVAQTFIPSSSASINFVALELQRVGNPGIATVSIRATDGNGKPTGNDLATGTLAEADVSLSSTWVCCDLSSYSLTGGTKYAIIVRAPTGSGSDAYRWYREDGAATYANGAYCESTNSGVDWTENTTYDQHFREGNYGLFLFSDIQNLECDLELDDTSKGNTMYCAKVEIKVTYTPSGGVTGSQGYIF